MTPTSRNGPCPCGSGRRFKFCCGRLNAAAASAPPGGGPSLDAILFSALRAQQANQLDEAERLYEAALAVDPSNIDALHMLGVVCLSLGKLSRAEQLISSADALCAQPVEAIRYNLALVRKTGGATRGEITIESMIAAERAAKRADSFPVAVEATTRLIAFYLPQFHRIPENDRWWGDGFTEWVNVRRAQPNFDGHYQPHEPSEMGYYDLDDEEVLVRQAALAREYGISGFCFYYYWFSGKRLLDMPVDRLLRSGRPDFPYCLCWANENWTRNWDGGNRELLMEQRYLPGDPEAFIRGLLPHFRDPRYIRIGKRPLLMVYRAAMIPDPVATFATWGRVCQAEDIEPPYIVVASTFGQATPPADIGADALSDFPPHGAQVHIALRSQLKSLNPDFRGSLIGYNRTVAHYLSREPVGFPHFPGVIPSWDNTARRQRDGTLVVGSTPEAFEIWLRELLYRARLCPDAEQRVIFINAWNEWAEGCHLEPDKRHGRAWLEACRNARRIPETYQGLFGEVPRPGRPSLDGHPADYPLEAWPREHSRNDAPAWGAFNDASVQLMEGGHPIPPLRLLWPDTLSARVIEEEEVDFAAPPVEVRFLSDAALHGMAWMSRDGKVPVDPAVYPSYFVDWVTAGRVHGQVSGDLSGLRERFYRVGWHVLHYNAGIHGHWLLEVLPKLLVIKEFIKRWPAYAAMPVFVPGTFPRYIVDHTRAVIPDVPIVVYEPGVEYIRCEALLVPTGGVNYGYHPWLSGALDGVAAPADGGIADGIFISRRSASGLRRFKNASEIEAIAVGSGLRVVYPEDYSLEQQIAIFRRARVVAGEFGSALHNTIFSRAGTRVLCLNRANCIQSRIARLRGHSIGYILPIGGQAVTWEAGPTGEQEFSISVDLFQSRLAELLAPSRAEGGATAKFAPAPDSA